MPPVPANVYRIADPTSDSLHRLGAVTATGEVTGDGATVVGRVDANGQALTTAGAVVGQTTDQGAIYRSDNQIGHVSREGSVYRGVALRPQALVGYVDPTVS